ncbi:DUF190 domain-containing protein [Mycolicibacterium sp. 018/SC-01/001]|uniref:DUF190 domain-containing protein n=1 Tax=Mycolicibacterium sp. 018/SC-01/001 TaxID=2592069 RepID=UPI00117D93EF|nr:DUF190 domain-containing protein [Mycolicibacterium sp. 018/SC-01/001]TRW77588.1 DUF190 domain-containing protein [Mycolicibacterium sp. 018/SC-01/001]
MTEILTLTAYFAERQRSGGRFVADALLETCAGDDIAASVCLRGIAGFGTTHVLRTDRSLTLSEDPPVTVTAADSPDRIRELAEKVVALPQRGLITLERGWLAPDAPSWDGPVRVSLLLGRKQPLAGAPGFVTVCDVLRRHDFAVADVYLGVDGTVAGERRRARFLSRNSDVPVLVTGVGPGAQALAAAAELTGLLDSVPIGIAPVLVCKVDGRTVARPPADRGIQKLTVHTNEDTRHTGRPVHRELTARLRATDHAGGATTMRGLWGFRGGQRPHGDHLLQLGRHVPVTTTLITTTVAADYAVVDELTAEHGVVTCEPIAGMIALHDGRRRGTLALD